MSPRDFRHGTEAGNEQHVRDGETPCEPCAHAKRIAARRRNKRKTMGNIYTRPLGEAHARLESMAARGASTDDIGEHLGMAPSQVWTYLKNGPEYVVYERNYQLIMAARPGRFLTTVGITRRIQALIWMGYSAPVIAAEAGLHHESIRDSRDEPADWLTVRVRTAVADAYDRLAMRQPVAVNDRYQAGISRSRNMARRKGWVSPLAWDDRTIDDPRATPEGIYVEPVGSPQFNAERTAKRLADLEHAAEHGHTLMRVLSDLEIGEEGLWKWCKRNGRDDLWRLFKGRQNERDGRGSDAA